MSESKNKIAGLYDLEETIGEGHYAVVKLARHVFTGEKVAVKIIDKQKLDQSTQTQMLQEVRLMKLVQHPHVVRLYEVIDTATKLYLVLELGDGGDMYDYIMKHEGGLGEETARKYFKQIVTAIQYCHRLHVVHRDLKPENVVFFEKLGMVKLTDFGFSNKFDPGQRLQTSCGSLAYSAPEILLGDAYDAPAVDIWSLGVILYMLVCGAAPFQEANDSETLTMIMDCNYSLPSHISKQCQSLISSMLCRDPTKRATLDQISQDPWLTADASIPLWDKLPLVTREHLSEEEHATILQKMAAGNIASRESIVESLDRNEYNHVTATYFLLAERKLRSQRQDTARHARNQKRPNAGLQPFKPETKTPSATVDSLLSPQETKKPNTTVGITIPSRHGGFRPRLRECSIVEEEEEEEEDENKDQHGGMPAKGLSRHSSTSSLADLASSPSLHLDLTLAFAAQRLEETASIPTPAPFPQSSQIGTGLSRQNSLRRSGENTSGSSPASERKSTPGSPASPTNTTTSPARFKLSSSSHSGRKLVNARSSPQLAMPLLNQIHEESEEGSPADPSADHKPRFKPVQEPGVPLGAPSGAAVLRRLEQRRRLHKSRTASCSSSDASDDDSENRKKRGGRGNLPGWRDNSSNDSDNQDPGGEGGAAAPGGENQAPGPGGGGPLGGGGQGSEDGEGEGGFGGGEGAGGLSGARHYRIQRNSARVRQSSSLNRISELHEADFSSENPEPDTPSGAEVGSVMRRAEYQRRQFTPQLSSESEGEPPSLQSTNQNPQAESRTDAQTSLRQNNVNQDEDDRPDASCDLLSRYLESVAFRSIRSRDDSLNSSDSEYTGSEEGGTVDPRDTGRRRSKVNLRQLEERLNMIQEECNRLSEESEESDDERSGTIDERSLRNLEDLEDMDTLDNDDGDLDDQENIQNNNNNNGRLEEYCSDSIGRIEDYSCDPSGRIEDYSCDPSGRIQDFLSSVEKTNCGRSRSEGWANSDSEDPAGRAGDVILLPLEPVRGPEPVRGRQRAAPNRLDKTLHRAHSCGSLLSRHRKVSGLWNILTEEKSMKAIESTTELTLTLSSVAAPISLLHLQAGTSRCCNLC